MALALTFLCICCWSFGDKILSVRLSGSVLYLYVVGSSPSAWRGVIRLSDSVLSLYVVGSSPSAWRGVIRLSDSVLSLYVVGSSPSAWRGRHSFSAGQRKRTGSLIASCFFLLCYESQDKRSLLCFLDLGQRRYTSVGVLAS